MLLGLISDVHGNVEAMNTALVDLCPRVDEILFAGDAMYEYRWCNEVVESARDLHMRYVLGNHEMTILGPHGERARSAETVRQAAVEFVRNVPKRIEVNVGGKRLLMVHGAPWPPYNEYLYPGNPLLERCADPDVDFLVIGHTHVPMVQRVGPTLVVNPGSLGESREFEGRDTVSYAVLDTDSDEVEIVRIPRPL